MVHEWIRRVSKRLLSRRRKKGEVHQPLYGTWAADCVLRQDHHSRKVYAGEVFE